MSQRKRVQCDKNSKCQKQLEKRIVQVMQCRGKIVKGGISSRMTPSTHFTSTPARPDTPDLHEGLSPRAGERPLGEEPTEALRMAIEIYCKNLVLLQPKVDITEAMKCAGLRLVEEAALMSQHMYQTLKSSGVNMLAAAAAGLWIAVKLGGIRAKSPNAVLVSQAAQVPLSVLLELELGILQALSWSVSSTLERHGIML